MDLAYPVVIKAARAWLKVGDLKIRMTGGENIPETGGALLAINHLSYVDYIMAGFPGAEVGRLTRFIAKQEIFDHPVGGPVMKAFHHIPIDRAHGAKGMKVAAEALGRGELVGIFPEGTISNSFLIKDVKTGAVRIAADAGVPLIPVVLWGTQRIMAKGHKPDLSRHRTIGISVGEPMSVTIDDDPAVRTDELKARMESMLDELIRNHPAEEQPPGSWWLPKTYGGSAPTLEEAAAAYAEERRLRAQKRAAKRASKNS